LAEIKGYRKNIEVDNQISIFKKIISIHEVLTGSKLKIAEKDILSYYCVFKGDGQADEMIMKDRVVGSMQVLYNTKSSLKKKKLLISLPKKRLKVCDNLDLDIINKSSFVISKISAKNIITYSIGDLKKEIINLEFEFKEHDEEKNCNLYTLDTYKLYHYYTTDDIEIYKKDNIVYTGQVKSETELRKICSRLMI